MSGRTVGAVITEALDEQLDDASTWLAHCVCAALGIDPDTPLDRVHVLTREEHVVRGGRTESFGLSDERYLIADRRSRAVVVRSAFPHWNVVRSAPDGGA